MQNPAIPAATTIALAVALAACSPAEDREPASEAMSEMPMMQGRSGGRMSGGMMDGEMMSGDLMGDMRTIQALLARHEAVKRRVEDLPKGVRTWTTSEDPEVTALIRTHVREMRARYERGQPIRMMDPLFRELFENRADARLTYEDIPGGVLVTHTSDAPDVVRLIRQHARGFVSEAVDQGMARAMRPTPLPEGYRPAE